MAERFVAEPASVLGGAVDSSRGQARHAAKLADKPIAHAIPQLDGLRFTAAFFVMVAHSTFAVDKIPYNWLYFIWSFAGIGLSLFFVLSGFVIHYNYSATIGRPGGLGAFAIARFARLYPLYFVAVLYEIWRSQLLVPMLTGQATDKAITLLFVGTLTQSWWYGVVGQHNLIYQWWHMIAVAWSISTEIAMYMLYPLACIAMRRLKGPVSNFALIVLLAVGLLVYGCFCFGNKQPILDWYQSIFGIVAHEGGKGTNTASAFNHWVLVTSPLARFWQFMLGVVVANVYIRRREWNLPALYVPPGLAFCLLIGFSVLDAFYLGSRTVAIFGQYHAHHGVVSASIISWLCALTLYSFAAAPEAVTARFFGCVPMVMAGDATYASYLLHVPILHYVNANIMSLELAGLPFAQALPRGINLLATYAIIVVVSYCVYRVLEAPARRTIRRHFNGTAIAVLVGIQVGLFLIGVSLLTLAQRGALP